MKLASKTFWRFVVRGPDGQVKAQSIVTPNTNTLEGAIDLSDYYLDTAAAANPQWFLGIAGNAAMTPDIGDTAAKITMAAPNPPTTNDWSEIIDYVEAARQLVMWGPADTATPPNPFVALKSQIGMSVFTMNAGGTLEGGFLANASGKGAVTGILYCVDSGAGSLAYNSGDTCEVTVATGFVEGPM